MNSIMIISKKKKKKKKNGNKLRLLFTDSDSLVYEIETKTISDDFSENKKLLGFSNYSEKKKNFDDSIALVVGKLRDE